jgi:hypothetical protein
MPSAKRQTVNFKNPRSISNCFTREKLFPELYITTSVLQKLTTFFLAFQRNHFPHKSVQRLTQCKRQKEANEPSIPSISLKFILDLNFSATIGKIDFSPYPCLGEVLCFLKP